MAAQSRQAMDMIFHGWSMSLFQAWQQWSTISSNDLKTRFDNQFWRMNCQMFSWLLSSGDRGGNGNKLMFAGTRSSLEPCQPA